MTNTTNGEKYREYELDKKTLSNCTKPFPNMKMGRQVDAKLLLSWSCLHLHRCRMETGTEVHLERLYPPTKMHDVTAQKQQLFSESASSKLLKYVHRIGHDV
jgi:hypothetical protein